MAIIKGTLIMVCDGSYKTNLDENRGFVACVINCTDIYGYAWGSLTTTYQVENEYIPEITGL